MGFCWLINYFCCARIVVRIFISLFDDIQHLPSLWYIQVLPYYMGTCFR